MLYCPNKNTLAWKNMESKLGSDLAHYYFYLKEGNFLNDEEINQVLNKESKIQDNKVNYQFKGIDRLMNNIDNAQRVWNKIKDKNLFWDKIQKDLQIPKDQIELLKISEGNTLTDIILDFYNNYSYTVEINTAKSGTEKDLEGEFVYIDGVDFTKGYTGWYKEDSQQNKIPATPEELIKINKKVSEQLSNTQYYSNLTAPGGTNYKELRFTTPLITPSIKGHARFAQDNDIGWARVDDKVIPGEDYDELVWEEEVDQEPGIPFQRGKKTIQRIGEYQITKTRRILEVQSDLFQKGRNSDNLTKNIGSKEQIITLNYDKQIGDWKYYVTYNYNEGKNKWKRKNIKTGVDEYIGQIQYEKDTGFKFADFGVNSSDNKFLQLLNKDNNWVTFFIKSLIQDSAKKGYEKVLFPRLDTIIQIESQNRFKTYAEAEAHYKNEKWELEDEELRKTLKKYQEELENRKIAKKDTKEIEQAILNQKERIRSHQPTLLNTANFYEYELANRLDDIVGGNKNNRAKGIWALNQITDEYGNTWNEISIQNKDLKDILFNIEEDNKDNIGVDEKLRSKYFYDGDVQKASVILERIAKSKHPLNKLAKHLQKYIVNDLNINLLSGSMVSETGIANFDPNVNEINIAEFAQFKKGSSEATLLHEVLHSLTYDEIHNDDSVISDFRMLYNYASLYKSSFNDQYPFKDLHEFLVAIFTNADFIKTALKIPPINKHNENINNLINTIIESSGDTLTVEEAHYEIKQLESKLFKDPSNKYNNLWGQILHWIASLFKITPDSSLYNDIFNISTNIIENQYQKELRGKEFNDYYRSIDGVPFNEGLQSKENPLNKLAKELGIYKKQLSRSQTINIKKNVEKYNKENGRSLFVEFKQMGQADLFTWNIVDKAGGQTKLFNISSEQYEESTDLSNKELEDKLKEFLERFNIDVEVVENLKMQGIDVGGFADILNNIIKLDKSKSNIKVFTEEVAHFAIEILGDDNTYVKALMKVIDKTDIYNDVLSQYNGVYSTEEQFKKEAIGKLLRDAILNNFEKQTPKINTLLRAIYNNFLRFINTLTGNKLFQQEVDSIVNTIAQSVINNTLKQGNKISNTITQLASRIPSNEEEALREMQATLQNRYNQLKKQGKLSQYPNIHKYKERLSYVVRNKSMNNRIITAVNELNSQILDDIYKFLSKDPANPGFIERLKNRDKSYTVTSATLNEIKYFTDNYEKALSDILSYLEKTDLFANQIEILKTRKREIDDINRAFNAYESTVLENVLTELFEGYEIDPGVTERRASIRAMVNKFYDPQTKDASWFRFALGSPRLSSNKIVGAIVNKINQYMYVVDKHTQKEIDNMLPLYLKLVDKKYDFNNLIDEEDGKLYLIGKYNFASYFKSLNTTKAKIAQELGFNTFEEIDLDTLSEIDYKKYDSMMKDWRHSNVIVEDGFVVPSMKHINHDFESKISDPDVKAFYDAMVKLRLEDLKRLPVEYRTLEKLYTLPQVTKGIIDVWAEKSGFKQYVKDKFKVTEDELQYGDKQIVTDYFGNELKYVPVNYFNKVNNPSRDIFFITMAFTEMSKNYEQMTIASSDSEFLLRVFGKANFQVGKKPYEGVKSNIYKMLETFFETHVYQKTDNRLVVKVGEKEYDVTKPLQRAHGYVRKMNLAGQLVTIVSNVLKSDIDTIIEGVIGKAFPLQTYISAKAEWMRNEVQIFSQMKSTKQTNKLHKILEFNALFEDLKQKYHRAGLNRAERGLFSDSFWYNGYEMAEYRKLAIISLSVMKDYKIHEGKLYSSRQLKRLGLTDEQITKLPSYYDNQEMIDGKIKLKQPLTELEQYKIYNKITYLSRTIDGKMEGVDKGAAYRNIIARFFLTHKNWLISGIDRRFKDNIYNLATEEQDIGYYRSTARFFQLLMNKEIGRARGLMAAWDTLSEAEKIGVHKTIGDIVFLTALFGIFSILHALENDDEPAADLITYLSSRVLLEHSSFINPTEIIEMFKTPFAAASSITRAQDFLFNFANFEEVDRGAYEGLPKNAKLLIKMMPYIKQYWELAAPKEKDKYLLNTGLKPFKQIHSILSE